MSYSDHSIVPADWNPNLSRRETAINGGIDPFFVLQRHFQPSLQYNQNTLTTGFNMQYYNLNWNNKGN